MHTTSTIPPSNGCGSLTGTSTRQLYVYTPFIRLPATGTPTRHLYVYPPFVRLPATGTSTRHRYVYPPFVRLPATGTSTRHRYIYPPSVHLHATVHLIRSVDRTWITYIRTINTGQAYSSSCCALWPTPFQLPIPRSPKRRRRAKHPTTQVIWRPAVGARTSTKHL